MAPLPLLVQHAFQEFPRVPCSAGNKLPGRSWLAPPELDHIIEVALELDAEGHLSREQFEEDAATTKDISFRCNLAHPNLRGHGHWCTHGPIASVISGLEMHGYPKVNHNQVGLGCEGHALVVLGIAFSEEGGGFLTWHQHDVLRLHVKVNDPPDVDVANSLHELLHSFRNPGHGDLLACPLGRGNVTVELPSRTEVRDQEDILPSVVDLIELQDVWVI
mmetsp:Transcript_33139/g.62126  ORF Transcript_33139/g.62126 Transcript_33139/m.62126 type:complete len:219 (-) Transcript_33139:216-872(-)